MAPRTILYTGKGGVGKTSVAAASALRCAAAGLRTLVMSTDPAHSLSDSLAVKLTGDPTAIGPSLWGQQISAQQELERNWAAMRDWLGDLLVARGVNRISAEELTVPPGLDELFSLLALKRHHESDEFDVIIVDCAPTGETLRLLAFPDAARWWLERVLPAQGQLMAAARPLVRAVLDVSLPGDDVLGDVQRLVENLIALNEILSDRRRVSVRLVLNPDRMVIDEARRTFTYLNLYGYLTDAVIVNRMFPDDVGDYFKGWRALQQDHLRDVHEAFAPIPVLCAHYFDEEVLGARMLEQLAEQLFEGHDVAALLHDRLAYELTSTAEGAALRLDLPFAEREDISLKKIGLELVLGVDGHKRTIMLPPSLAEHRAAGAKLSDGALLISFLAPTPAS
jgi:arsenite/tail-anchored protein-transporting ATPase